MRLLTKDYFIRNKWLALLGAVCGIGIAALFGLGSHFVAFMFPWLIVSPFINCPLTLKTQVGGIWWAAYACLVANLAIVYFVRL
jgi:hypothetical protein